MRFGVSFRLAIVVSALAWPAQRGVSAWIEPADQAPIISAGANGGDLLARASLANELLYSDLQNFVCNERIVRYRGSLTGTEGRRIDIVTSKVSFENGTEHYTDIRQNDTLRPSLSSLYGAWSEGEFGTLLRQTQTLLRSHAALSSEEAEVNGSPAVLYRLNVSEQDSPWDLEVESRHYRIPFRTDVWVSRSSGQVLKIERTSIGIPLEVGISEIQWSVTLKNVDLNGKTWLLPRNGEYAVSYADSRRREWNVLSFSGYRRYGSEATLSFDSK